MKRYAWLAVGVLLALGACAHPITIIPDTSRIPAAMTSRVPRNAAYYIADADRDVQVTTPGGGGDKVSYFPVRDLEHGLFRVLSSVFDRVYALPALDDRTFLTSRNIAFVFEPTITTESSGSVLFWPPTDFKISIACRAYDLERKLIWEKTVVGQGRTSAWEVTKDFSLAANRAAEDALKQLQDALVAEPLFRRP